MATRLTGNSLKAIAPSTKDQSHSWRRITFLFSIRPMQRHWDSLGSWTPRRGFRMPGTGFQSLSVELGFWIQSLVGFWIPWAVCRVPWPGISVQRENRGFVNMLLLNQSYELSCYWAVLSCCLVVLTFESVDETLCCDFLKYFHFLNFTLSHGKR